VAQGREVSKVSVDKPEIGRRIRTRRKAFGLSLRQLADRIAISAGFLGQVERGESNPSIATLQRIAEALDTPVERLLSVDHDAADSGSSQATVVIDAVSERRLANEVVQIELLSRDFSRKMEFFRARMQPGASKEVPPLEMQTEQVIYVLSGALKVTLDTGEHILQHDHFLYFDGNKLRRLETASDEETRWISVITPPVS
jgi:transcriptional regulator with XRE-family HTH domain